MFSSWIIYYWFWCSNIVSDTVPTDLCIISTIHVILFFFYKINKITFNNWILQNVGKSQESMVIQSWIWHLKTKFCQYFFLFVSPIFVSLDFEQFSWYRSIKLGAILQQHGVHYKCHWNISTNTRSLVFKYETKRLRQFNNRMWNILLLYQ